MFHCSYSLFSMLFKKYFKHFRLPERSNKGQGSNPHNIFPSFFPETRFGGGVKSFEISSKAFSISTNCNSFGKVFG